MYSPRLFPLALLLAGCSTATPLVQLADEPPGDSCPAGGVAIAVGLDADASGALDEGEVEETRYVCHGEPGADGEQGEDGAPGEDGSDGNDGNDGDPGPPGEGALASHIQEPVELIGITGNNPYWGEWLAETDGFVSISENNANSSWRVYAGATSADTVLCRNCSGVPIPSGWTFKVEMFNNSTFTVYWQSLEPSEG
ncbi:MAG: hypothetical protein VX498_03695 [Myxococcota bacterium]|nr:hypothetical protein [Myxococcota bacterium]